MEKICDFVDMSPAMTKELNAIAEKYHEPYTEFIDGISALYDDDTGFWWDTPLASRNIYISWCFMDVCVLRLVLNFISRHNLKEIAVSCNEIKEAVLHNHKDVKIHVPPNGLHNRELHLKRSLQEFNHFKEKILAIQKYRRNDSLIHFTNRELILVGTYRIAAETKTGTLRDRYFAGLKDNTDENVVFLSTCGNIVKGETQLLNVIHDCDDHICMEDWIGVGDFEVIEQYMAWSQSVKVRQHVFDGMDITDIIEAAFLAGSGSLNTMYGIARGEVLCRIIDQYGLKVKSFIDWYEGQASSNATVRRFRRRFPHVPTMACAPFPYGENNIGQYPSKAQLKKRVVPEYFGVPGEIWLKQVRRFSPELKCVLTPSFRHQKIFDTEKYETSKNEGILLVLSYFKESSKQLLATFGRAISLMDDSDIDTVYIKNHPVNQNMTIADYGVDEGLFKAASVVYVDNEIYEASRGKRFVVLCKTSAGFELMLKGARTINFASTGELIYFGIPEDLRAVVPTAYDADDLSDCLKSHRGKRFAEELIDICERAFTRVNRETVMSFLELRVLNKDYT